ncbi:hypothetical protein E2I00_001546 [Balaenoptera physalus]|uniref:Uncharacterized protein n=1 Tax=Balaenoptera physalus TaxID=9770 RepID=A0A6A1QHN5_BALPH|nr:hypothetical protein E2I00_001546 [Balaenoptera physalus]
MNLGKGVHWRNP